MLLFLFSAALAGSRWYYKRDASERIAREAGPQNQR
jgi:hypothetical protein